MAKNLTVSLFLGVSLAATPALAQEETTEPAETQESAGPQSETADPESAEGETVDEDNMADDLNSRQQLQQTFTLKRTVDGEVIETKSRTVTYSRDEPYRETEAGKSTVERLKSSFDGEALTRTEAFEEAKLDFTIADVDRNGAMTAEEFAGLVDNWRKNSERQAEAPSEEIARQRKYDAFLEEIDPETEEKQTEAYAREKFSFMAGAAETLSLQDFIREQLLDFDSMDANKDRILAGDELKRYRALNRGETVDQTTQSSGGEQGQEAADG